MSEPFEALERGEAWVDLSAWWKVAVGGGDAAAWLNDLLTAELGGLDEGEARRSFLLTPTGRIRAAVGVVRHDGGFLLLQDPMQGERIDALLGRFVLSSDVRLVDRTEELRLIAMPGRREPPPGPGVGSSPSVIGPGADVILPRGEEVATPVAGLTEASADDLERWRIRRGVARVGMDLGPDSLPHEVEIGEAIAYGKGCFLGQEAVARVRNLGHPPFVVLAADADGEVRAGEELAANGAAAGTVTSRAETPEGIALLARVRWASRDVELETSSGVRVRVRGLASA